jgi:KDO2-lipid IV(A) lauroyltransferase
MTLSARLAQQTGATLLLAWGERLSWGRGYTVHVSPLAETLSDDKVLAATQINEAMEQLIQQQPGQYLWGYARYKQPRREES